MLNNRQLLTFYWAARLGSFTAAARRLSTTQSVVSMRIRELERDVGVELFDRNRRSAALTLKGRKLLAYAEELLRISANARDELAGDEAIPDVLRLGVAEVVSITWLPKLIRAIHARYPTVRLELDEALTGDLLSHLHAGALDLVLAPGKDVGHKLAARSLGHVTFAWMASPALKLPKKRLTPRELERWPLIALSEKSFHHSAIEAWFVSGNARFQRVYTCKSTSVAASLAAAGLGLTFLPTRCYQREINEKTLRVVPTSPAAPPVPFIAVCAADQISHFANQIAELAVKVSDFTKPALRGVRS